MTQMTELLMKYRTNPMISVHVNAHKSSQSVNCEMQIEFWSATFGIRFIILRSFWATFNRPSRLGLWFQISDRWGRVLWPESVLLLASQHEMKFSSKYINIYMELSSCVTQQNTICVNSFCSFSWASVDFCFHSVRPVSRHSSFKLHYILHIINLLGPPKPSSSWESVINCFSKLSNR